MSQIQIFAFASESTSEVRVGGTWDNPLFVARDVCDALGIIAYRDALATLEDYMKGCRVIVDTLGGPQDMATVTEAGLYELITRSRKPSAKRFKRWVYEEVLPSIRRTGAYSLHTAPATEPKREPTNPLPDPIECPTKRQQAALRRHWVQMTELVSSIQMWMREHRMETMTGTPAEFMTKVQAAHPSNFAKIMDGRLPTSPRMMLERLVDARPYLASLNMVVSVESGQIAVYKDHRPRPELVKRRRNRRALERTIVNEAVMNEVKDARIILLEKTIDGLQELLEAA